LEVEKTYLIINKIIIKHAWFSSLGHFKGLLESLTATS